jgi:CubicO group peptidase (beta-lactamase class C family)
MKPFAWMLLALCASARAASGDELDRSLERLLREEKLAGAVYGVIEAGKPRVGAVGFANHDTQELMRAHSKVHIGSVTKTLVALGVLRLASQGRVSLDAPISGYLPAVPLDNPWNSKTPVTLRHLLDHTAGLDDLRLWHLFSRNGKPNDLLIDAVARDPAVLRVRVEPGTRFSYSNLGYTLAGMVIEAVTQERYESWLDRELLRPLGMADSTFEFVTQSGPQADPRLAWGHFDDFSLAGAQAVAVRPAAQFTTTAADMMRVAQFLMGDGRIGESAFIDAALLRQMARARTPAAAAGLESGYALGLARRDRHGAVGNCHLGNIIGFRAALCVYPEHRKAFFIAFNSDSETARYARFDELLTHALQVPAPVSEAITENAVPLEWEGRYVFTPARFEQFRYFDLLLDSVDVRAAAAGLSLRSLGADPQLLVAVGPRLFRADDRAQASHVLLVEGGEHLIGDGTRTWQRISGARFVMNWVSLSLGVAGLFTLLLLIPWRAWRRGETLLQPASLALALLVVTPALFALQPFMAMGDVTAASICLYLATVALPVLMAAQVAWAWRARARLKSWRVHGVAATLVLQWCGVLYAWDLLPFALWR